MTKQSNDTPPISYESDSSLSKAERDEEIADLDTLFYDTPAFGMHEAEQLDDDIEAFETEQSDLAESYTKKQKLRSRFSEAGLYLTATDLAGKLAGRLREGRERREAEYAAEDGDNRRTRVSNFIGRNALRIASGTIIGLGVGAAIGLKAEHTIEALQHSPSLDPSHQEMFANISQAADTRYIVGGHTDKSSAGLNSIMNGLQGHGAKNTVNVSYPAEIMPVPGDSHTLNQSSDIASSQIWDAYQKNPNKPIELIGYSEGTQAVQDAANKIAAQNGGELPRNVKVFLIATPNAETSGFFNTPYAKLTKPVLDAMGISTDRPIPKGAHVIAMNTDFWANSGSKPITTQLSQLIGLAGDGHRSPADGMRSSTSVIDGVVYETRYHKGTQTAALRVLEQRTNIPVTKAMDDLGQAIAPQGEVGKPVAANADNVVKATANLAKEGLHDRGIRNADATIDQIVAAIPKPVLQQGLDLLNAPNKLGDVMNQAPAPSGNASHAVQVAPAIPTEQIQQTVNDTANNLKANLPPQIKQQAAPVIDQIQGGINNFFKNLRRR